MNFRRNRTLINVLISVLAATFTAGIFFTQSNAAELTAHDQTIRILERWTSAHWGQDCFVWVVHYPEELADPWTESEALRAGMTDAEKKRFHDNFVSELNLNTSETFLVSVYSFGPRPVNLNPVRDNVSLLSSTGERIKPTRYDSALDNPSAGVVQGLVFFPKQSNKDYVIGLKGMGRTERIFSFAPPETPPAQPKTDVVVVNVPRRQPRKPVPVPVDKPTPPTPPPPPAIPPRPIKPIFSEESRDMAEFVRSVRGGNTSQDRTPAVTPPTPRRQSNTENAYSSRETVLRRFLNLWANGSYSEMYDMLSDGSKRVISRENFAREAAKASDIRAGIKGGDYRIDWVGDERAKVITVRKTLVFRSVSSRSIGVTREGSSWRVVW
ncbi:MAG: hypothetical protein IJQ75_05480 [Synergistaceae bacterium]|nr:hypothetical protein [Synergistaceae bacterium]